jgi:hypothetical protein
VEYTKNEMKIIKNLPPKKAVDNSAENFLCPKFTPDLPQGGQVFLPQIIKCFRRDISKESKSK